MLEGTQCEISEEWINELEDNEQGEETMVEETWNHDDSDFDLSDNGSNQPDEIDMVCEIISVCLCWENIIANPYFKSTYI